MEKQNTKLDLLGNAPIPRALLSLGLPTMVGMLINALYSLVDAYFVGGLGTDAMGAITVAYPLGQIVVGLGLLFGNGAAAYISRLLGRGDKETAGKVASTALYSSVVTGTVAIIFCLVFLNPILGRLCELESVTPYAISYTGIYIAFSICNVFNVTMNNIVSSEGAAKIAMCALLAGAVLNVMLDPIFIYSLNMGVAGAAVATGISQMVSSAVYLIYIFRKKSVFSFSVKAFSLTKEIMPEILKIGVPTFLFQLLTSLSISMMNNGAAEYSESALAAMGPVTKIMSMGTLVVFGFLKGFQPIAGFSYGAGKYDRLRQAIKTSIIWSTAFCVVFGLSIAVFSGGIMSSFTKDDGEMIRIGQIALRANGTSFMLFGFYTVYSFLFLVMGKAKEGFFLGACRQGICFIPVILLLSRFFGLNGVLFAQPVADVISAVVAIWMALRFQRELKERESATINGGHLGDK